MESGVGLCLFERRQMKVGYRKVCSRPSDNPAFICRVVLTTFADTSYSMESGVGLWLFGSRVRHLHILAAVRLPRPIRMKSFKQLLIAQ